MIIKLIKQLFCEHDISINTEADINKSFTSLFWVKSSIKCNKCEKTFPIPAGYNCCYINHLHQEIIRDQIIKYINSSKQP
jgi:hypothetical protein